MNDIDNISTLVKNTKKSSSELYSDILEIIKKASDNYKNKMEFINNIQAINKILKHNRREMVIFSTLASNLDKFISQESATFGQLKSQLSKFIQTQLTINEQTVEHAVNFFQGLNKFDSVLTISYSKLVFETIKGWKPKKVFICESRPLFEGVRLSNDLKSYIKSIEVILITDAMGPKILQEKAECLVIGMDAWFPDGSISNKTGSLALALAGHYVKKPVFVIGNAMKKTTINSDAYSQVNHIDELKNSYNDKIDEKINYFNEYFDIIPSKLITQIIE